MNLLDVRLLSVVVVFLFSTDLFAQTYLRKVEVSSGSQLKTALRNARAGDDIVLRAGVYNDGPYNLRTGGTEANPIRIRAENKHQAIVRGRNRPTRDSKKSDCFTVSPTLFNEFLRGPVEWVVFEDLKFESCWAEAVQTRSSNFLVFRNNHITGSQKAFDFKKYYIHNVHHFIAEGNFWDQDGSGDRAILWREVDWTEAHHGKHSYYNGTLLGGRHLRGSVIFRHNYAQNAFNVLRITANQKEQGKENINVDIHNNHFFRIRDNSVEPEDTFENWWIYNNNFDNSHGHLSFTEITGGHTYIFGNVGRTHERYGTTSNNRPRAIKFYTKSPFPNRPMYKFHNSWWIEQLLSGRGEHLRHFNNAYLIPSGTPGERFISSGDVRPSYQFDYDVMSFLPNSLTSRGHERNGIGRDPQFRNPAQNDYRLRDSSPAIGAGRDFVLNEHVFADAPWSPTFEGAAPDAGAYVNGELFQGPAFREQDGPYPQRLRLSRISYTQDSGEIVLDWTRKINFPSGRNQTMLGLVDPATRSAHELSCQRSHVYQIRCHYPDGLSGNRDQYVLLINSSLRSQSNENVTWFGAPYQQEVRIVNDVSESL